MNAPEPLHDRRMVVLGASNVVRGMSRVVASARDVWGGPLDVLFAAGHGRSLGARSSVLGRVLPGILECGLWEALRTRPAAPAAGLLTDIGNDVLYGFPLPQIVQWVRSCLQNLRRHCDRLVVTELPMDRLQELEPWRFYLARSVFFPGSRLRFAEAMEICRALNADIAELAREFDAELIRPQRDWYGADPIHIRYLAAADAWRDILSPLGQIASPVPLRWRDWWSLTRVRPSDRSFFGWRVRFAQPSARLRDGSCVSFY